MKVRDRINEYMPQLVNIRHDLHAHPELGFEERRTGDLIAKCLVSWGIEVHRGIGRTGIVGILRGRSVSQSKIGLRAEMDALPIQEATNLPYRSQAPGIFHGCGHDGHMVMLLGAARYLAETRNFSGSAVFIFQPAEEGLGGARAMIADGLFERFPCDEIYALHNNPDGARGNVYLRSGPAMAAADFFDIRITGRGSHAAQPHQSIDPLSIGAAMFQALQSIVSRNVDPLHSVVLSITRFVGGGAYNVIPDSAELAGTIRTFDESARNLIASRVRAIAAGMAKSFDANIDVEIRDVFSILENWPEQTALVASISSGLFGENHVELNAPPLLTSEDFADMLKIVPGAYVLLGQKPGPALHNPNYAFDDAVIPDGATLLASIVEERSQALTS